MVPSGVVTVRSFSGANITLARLTFTEPSALVFAPIWRAEICAFLPWVSLTGMWLLMDAGETNATGLKSEAT